MDVKKGKEVKNGERLLDTSWCTYYLNALLQSRGSRLSRNGGKSIHFKASREKAVSKEM